MASTHPSRSRRNGVLPLTRLTLEQERFMAHHWNVLDWARRALRLGARLRVVEQITGIERNELLRVFFSKAHPRKSPGALPTSAEWYLQLTIARAVHVATFYATYDKLRAAGHIASIALIQAYERYLRAHVHDGESLISFDRAFDLITHVDGIWSTRAPELEAVVCAQCNALFVTAPGIKRLQSKNCPVCKLTRRLEEAPSVIQPESTIDSSSGRGTTYLSFRD